MNRTKLQERYELKEVLGRGGMGVVYKAWDTLMKREVALKTILDIDNPATVQLFYKEWNILATMVHPNVVSIYDIGEFDQGGAKQPFFVMPLLPGVTLDRLIKEGSRKLSVAGTLEIVQQACRGLHAAHERGLVHRDVKPSNIFVMDDNSVKIIDFGIARQAAANARTSVRGTLYYLAPEQLESQPPTPLSDLFALAVVTFEALTRRRPFTGATEAEVVDAIRHLSPPPVSELNHEVSYPLSQVVHKAMAKQPWHRFANMREFGDSLEKALRNQPLECFDSTRIKPRLQRAAASFEAGDYVFATEVLTELEAEGHLEREIAMLRGRVDEAVRQTRIRQMLGSARRFFEATEFSLALRKIQEALDLDAEDLDALSLKEQVEKERRTRQISEWIALGRQHLDNQAFGKAREALENVVNLKPNDTGALGLLAEVGRREKEISLAREEKSRLYQSAQHAWEKGEVTAALSRLEALIAMERDLPESDSDRGGTYRSFYNQVHTEHDALKNAYEEARRNLSLDNFEAASAACRQHLSKYPNHTLFQALQFDVEERKRQKLSGVIAETDRRVEAEPDLDKRVAILEEALRLYPGESHFERAMRLVRDKRDLVNSIVAKARFFEDRGQFNEALDQWQILKSIHERQPGLAFEIQRLVERRDQQARDNAKAHWVEQADKYLEGGDYERATQTVESALAEFPGEAELLELDKLIRKSRERGRQALERLERARELGEQAEPEQALGALREAHQLDPRNTVVRTVLVNSLLERARGLADSDGDAADAAVRELLELEPKHAPALSLASRIADRKRDDFIGWCLAQARRLQTDGDLEGALAVALQGLGAYPNEPRLQQLHATLKRAKAEARRQLSDCREITGSDSGDRSLTVAAQMKPRSRDREGAVAAVTSERALARPRDTAADATPLPPTLPDALVSSLAPLPVQQSRDETIPASEHSTASAFAQLHSALSASWTPVLRKRILQGAMACAAVLAVAMAGGAIARRHKPLPQPPLGKYKLKLVASPSEAAIEVDGKPCGPSPCEFEFGLGSHLAEARLAGYRPSVATFTAGPNSGASPIVLALQPLMPTLAISTDLTEGMVQVDGVDAAQLQSGSAELPSLAAGTHEISVAGGGAKGAFTLELAPGRLPSVAGPIRASNLRGFVVVTYGSQAELHGSMSGFRVTLDGTPFGNLGAASMEFKDLSAGSHEVVLDGPTGQRDKMVFESQPAGAVYASLATGANMGVLNIVAGEDQADVLINGVKYQRPTQQGRLLIYLPPKKYTVRVQKAGFAPVERAVELRAFQETRAEFKLTPAAPMLVVHRAPPGSEVLIDGNRAGTVRADGEFSLATLPPGQHSVQMRREQFKPLELARFFVRGKTVEFEGSLESLLGTLRVELTPADARLRIRREGETQDRELTGGGATLPEGVYTLTASAQHFQDGTATVRVLANHTATAALALKPVAARAPQTALQPFTRDDWQRTGGWTSTNGLLSRRGGNLVPAPVDFAQAHIRFTILSVKGKRIEWALGLSDQKSYWLFQLDNKNFVRTLVANGSKTDQVKTPHGLDRKSEVGIDISVTPTAIVHSVLRGREWVVIDKWEFPEGTVHGRFGLNIPGKDEIALKDFALTPVR